MSQSFALAESDQWVGMKGAEETLKQRAELKARRQVEWVELCKRLGLSRQLALKLARDNYEEIRSLISLACEAVGTPVTGQMHVGYNRNGSGCLEILEYTTAFASIRSIVELNSEIPYAVLLALSEAKGLGCFNRFAVLAPLRHFCIYSKIHRDPALLGVIESPSEKAIDAVYFLIAKWD